MTPLIPPAERIVRHFENSFIRCAGKQFLCQFLVAHPFWQRPFQTAGFRPLEGCGHRIAGTLCRACNVRFVEPQAFQPENLAVVGRHLTDLLCRYLQSAGLHIHILPRAQLCRKPCSTSPEAMLNLPGGDAQSRAEYSKLRLWSSRAASKSWDLEKQ